MEQDPIRFMVRVVPEALRKRASDLGAMLGARGQDIAFVENATTGINAVLRGLDLGPEDELLTLSHVYPAVDNTLEYLAKRYGCRVVRVELPMPLKGPQQVLDAVAAGLSDRTRIAVLDHVTSFSALVTPIAELVELCHAQGVPVLVDGAHAPGMLALDLDSIGADYYVGNCHKWLWAPKGCAFLHVARELQSGIHPTVISLREAEGFPFNFDWTGTKDPSAWLALGAALEFHGWLGGNAVAQYNHELVVEASERIASQLGWELPCPVSMTGSIRAMRIPGSEKATREEAMALHDYLADQHHIEALVHAHEGLWVRLSAQVYNERGDYAAFIAAMELRGKGVRAD
jgi:isopenicillin-N epimerase